MISRLLLTTAISLTLTGLTPPAVAFAQEAGPSAAETATPSVAPSQTAATTATVTLSEGVNVTEQDRARIGEAVARMNVKSLRGVDFTVSAGARVPRELRVHRLPADVTQIVPSYRDHRFLVVEKDIVIVEPKTNKIIAVLKPESASPATAKNAAPAVTAPTAAAPAAQVPSSPAPTAAATAAPATAATNTVAPAAPAPTAAAPVAAEPAPAPARDATAESERPKAKKQASRAQRRAVTRAERDDWRRSNAEVYVGQRVPDDVVLYRVPRRYYYEVPGAREYRYPGYAGSWRGRTIYREYD